MGQDGVYKYLIPVDDLTEADKMTFRAKAVSAGLKRALNCKVIPNYAEGVARHLEPVTDFGMAAGGWVTAAFAAPGAAYSAFNALTPTVAVNRVIVFYGCWVESLPFAPNLLNFREGAAGGSTYGVFSVEELAVRNQMAGYFSEPIWYDPQRVMSVTWTARIVGGTQRCGLMGYAIEPRGLVISA